jgi:N-acetylmuramoyl-L-alanine amidase
MKTQRNIEHIVIHCTATQPNTKVEDIKKYWKEVRKWDVPGYHFLIKADGDTVKLLDVNKNSNGVYEHNSTCINIAYIGGIDKQGAPKDTRTKAQEDTMFDLIVSLIERYPKAKVLGHRDFPNVAKACPCFDVKTWLANYVPDLGLAA